MISLYEVILFIALRSSNGRTTGSGPVYWGSSPYLRTLDGKNHLFALANRWFLIFLAWVSFPKFQLFS